MDCPQCRRECGQNDKFCSECGYKLCSARTPVTELSVPGKETGDSTDVSSADLSRVRRNSADWTRPSFLASPSTSGAEPRRSSAVIHRVVPLDLQPRTECTAIVSQEMEEGVQNNATPKTFNRNSNRQEGREHPVSESQVHSDDHTHHDNHTHCNDHTPSDDHTQSQSLGPPDTGSPADEAEETMKKRKDKSHTSWLESENQQRDITPAEQITPGTPAPDSEYQKETTDNRSSLGPESTSFKQQYILHAFLVVCMEVKCDLLNTVQRKFPLVDNKVSKF
ncbi:uncharacterized protein LOC135258469 [Anguilla rostrata]|uniref:uncharacterized protein LOC135258469 n=1 Tax=Anguilla rostrata TaxID=7938 RepID=UPI0030D47BB2